ncbi:MAG: hypothetical protein Lokiarch_37620, partial [Candidatus Lokiarchaeum sp. GC14_75]
VYLGQSIGLIESIETVSDIVNSIVEGAEKCLTNAFSTIKKAPVEPLIIE